MKPAVNLSGSGIISSLVSNLKFFTRATKKMKSYLSLSQRFTQTHSLTVTKGHKLLRFEELSSVIRNKNISQKY